MTHKIGIDVSRWQGVIDWQAIKDQGVEWACARIGLGWKYIDPQWAVNLEGAHAVGIPIGGYWVPSFPSSAGDSINGLKNGLEESNQRPDFLVVDVEKFNSGWERNRSRDHIWGLSNWMRAYLGNNKVWQYTSASIWNSKIGDGVLAKNPGSSHNLSSDYALWVAHYRAPRGLHWKQYGHPSNMPTIPSAWVPSLNGERGDLTGWRVWQVTSGGVNLQGIQSSFIDVNVMKPEFFVEMFGVVTPPDDPVSPVDPPKDVWGYIFKV